ncbi:MAG: OsmC family protein [Gammaproteobacteria bacterium]
MAEKLHRYHVHLVWTGGSDSVSLQGHSRDFILSAGEKPPLQGSSDGCFRGDAARWNPEDLLVAALSACHQLWYLGLCAASGICVIAYEDDAEGVMLEEKPGGAGQFKEVILHPHVTLAAGSDQAKSRELHHTAHERCFIARSVNFPVTPVPTIVVEPASD